MIDQQAYPILSIEVGLTIEGLNKVKLTGCY